MPNEPPSEKNTTRSMHVMHSGSALRICFGTTPNFDVVACILVMVANFQSHTKFSGKRLITMMHVGVCLKALTPSSLVGARGIAVGCDGKSIHPEVYEVSEEL